jgi:hypothetical protein
MSLNLTRETVDAGIPVFSKIIELFTGGFSLTVTGFNTGVKLPKGSLLVVNEAARTAVPVKTAVSAGTGVLSSATAHLVEGGHHFQVGDIIGHVVGGGAYPISQIIASGSNDILVVGTSIAIAPEGRVFFQSSALGTDQAAISASPNALSFFDVLIESGASVAALRRGTAYKNRIQAHQAGHLTSLPSTIQISESL